MNVYCITCADANCHLLPQTPKMIAMQGDDAFPILKKFLMNGMPVLIISHMGWLSYNKEYEIFREMGGVVDHYVVITGFKNDEVVYVNDPNPDFFRKNAELAVEDFRIGWAEKIPEIYKSCPMLVVKGKNVNQS